MAVGTTIAVVAAAAVLVARKSPSAQQQLARLKRAGLRIASQGTSVSGFVVHSVWDVVSHGFTAKTTLWDRALRRMDTFLRESGIDKEIHCVMSRPRFLDIVALLSKIQEQEHPPVVTTDSNSISTDIPTMEEAARFVCFVC